MDESSNTRGLISGVPLAGFSRVSLGLGSGPFQGLPFTAAGPLSIRSITGGPLPTINYDQHVPPVDLRQDKNLVSAADVIFLESSVWKDRKLIKEDKLQSPAGATQPPQPNGEEKPKTKSPQAEEVLVVEEKPTKKKKAANPKKKPFKKPFKPKTKSFRPNITGQFGSVRDPKQYYRPGAHPYAEQHWQLIRNHHLPGPTYQSPQSLPQPPGQYYPHQPDMGPLLRVPERHPVYVLHPASPQVPTSPQQPGPSHGPGFGARVPPPWIQEKPTYQRSVPETYGSAWQESGSTSQIRDVVSRNVKLLTVSQVRNLYDRCFDFVDMVPESLLRIVHETLQQKIAADSISVQMKGVVDAAYKYRMEPKERHVPMSENKTYLQDAVLSGSLHKLEQCLARSQDVNVTDDGGGTVLHEAVIAGNIPMVDLLLRFKVNVNAPRKFGIRPLHDATLMGHTYIVIKLVDFGADPLFKTDFGNTPFDLIEPGLETSADLRNILIASMQEKQSRAGQEVKNGKIRNCIAK